MTIIRNKNKAYDLARVLACVFVISDHITAWWKYGDINASGWTTSIVYDSLSLWCVPMFFMLSGACSRNTNVKKNMVRIAKFFLVFIIVSIFFAATESVFNNFGLEQTIFNLFKNGFITKYHLWFMPQFILVLSISPILNYVLDKIGRAHV